MSACEMLVGKMEDLRNQDHSIYSTAQVCMNRQNFVQGVNNSQSPEETAINMEWGYWIMQDVPTLHA